MRGGGVLVEEESNTTQAAADPRGFSIAPKSVLGTNNRGTISR